MKGNRGPFDVSGEKLLADYYQRMHEKQAAERKRLEEQPLLPMKELAAQIQRHAVRNDVAADMLATMKVNHERLTTEDADKLPELIVNMYEIFGHFWRRFYGEPAPWEADKPAD